MSARFFKAVRPDGMDFWTGTINYAPALGGDPITLPPVDNPYCCTGAVLHASTVATETLVGDAWPCRLFLVEGEPVAEDGLTRGFFSLRVVEEIDPYLALGPNGAQVARMIEQSRTLKEDQASALRTTSVKRLDDWVEARDAARAAALEAALAAAAGAAGGTAWATTWYAEWGSERSAGRNTAAGAAGDAARGAIVRGLISEEHYQVLAGRWESVMGPIFENKETEQ